MSLTYSLQGIIVYLLLRNVLYTTSTDDLFDFVSFESMNIDLDSRYGFQSDEINIIGRKIFNKEFILNKKYSFNISYDLKDSLHHYTVHSLHYLVSRCLENATVEHEGVSYIIKFCKWREFFQAYLEYTTDSSIISRSLKSVEHLSRLYILYFCLIRDKFNGSLENRTLKKLALEFNIENHLPNPCGIDHCDSIPYAIKDSCKNKPFPIRVSDFECTCLKPFYWIKNKCINLCDSLYATCGKDEKCIVTNTKPGKNFTECIKNEFNPCKQAKNNSPTGNQACGKNGKCKIIRTIGTVEPTYECKCNLKHKHNDMIMYPNCDGNVTNVCDERSCVNGVCVVDPVQHYFIKCQCYYGWTSHDCSKPIAQWQLWSKWSSCTPKCSEEPVQRRTRKCSSKNILDCALLPGPVNNTEIKPCAPQFCPVRGKWTVWSPWSLCTQSCDYGIQEAYRQCEFDLTEMIRIGVVIQKPCIGNHTKQKSCYIRPCGLTHFTTVSKVFISASVLVITFICLYIGLQITRLYAIKAYRTVKARTQRPARQHIYSVCECTDEQHDDEDNYKFEDFKYFETPDRISVHSRTDDHLENCEICKAEKALEEARRRFSIS